MVGFLALNYFFTAPRDSLDVQKGDDLVALVAFAAASARAGLDRLTPRRAAPHLRAARARDADPARPHDATALGRRPRHASSRVSPTRSSTCSRSSRARCGRRGRRDERQPARAPRGHTPSCGSARSRWRRRRGASTEFDPLRPRAARGAGRRAGHRRRPAPRLESEAREARIAAQVGRTRSGFLSAVTHNLRTPLASIKAAASTLRSPRSRLDDDRPRRAARHHLRRDRPARAAGHQHPRAQPDPRRRARSAPPAGRRSRDLAQAAVRRLRPLARAHRVRLDVGREVPRRRGRHRDDGAGLRQPARERVAVRATRFGDPRLGPTVRTRRRRGAGGRSRARCARGRA